MKNIIFLLFSMFYNVLSTNYINQDVTELVDYSDIDVFSYKNKYLSGSNYFGSNNFYSNNFNSIYYSNNFGSHIFYSDYFNSNFYSNFNFNSISYKNLQSNIGTNYFSSIISIPTIKPTFESIIINNPSSTPSQIPSLVISDIPTIKPTYIPTFNPTFNPTRNPTINPTRNPTINPTYSPTKSSTRYPTKSPTRYPIQSPTIKPSVQILNNETQIPQLSFDTGIVLAGLSNPNINQTIINLIIDSVAYSMDIPTDFITWIKNNILQRRLTNKSFNIYTSNTISVEVVNQIKILLTGNYVQYNSNPLAFYSQLTNNLDQSINKGTFYSYMLNQSKILNITNLNFNISGSVYSGPNVTIYNIYNPSNTPTSIPSYIKHNNKVKRLNIEWIWLIAVLSVILFWCLEVLYIKIKQNQFIRALTNTSQVNELLDQNQNHNNINHICNRL